MRHCFDQRASLFFTTRTRSRFAIHVSCHRSFDPGVLVGRISKWIYPVTRWERPNGNGHLRPRHLTAHSRTRNEFLSLPPSLSLFLTRAFACSTKARRQPLPSTFSPWPLSWRRWNPARKRKYREVTDRCLVTFWPISASIKRLYNARYRDNRQNNIIEQVDTIS